MNINAYKHADGTKSLEVEFNQGDAGESIFVSMLLDRFLDIPVLGFNAAGNSQSVVSSWEVTPDGKYKCPSCGRIEDMSAKGRFCSSCGSDNAGGS